MSSSLLPAETPEKNFIFAFVPVIMANAGKENDMGKLRTFLASAVIGLSPAGGGLEAQTAEPRRPQTEKTDKTDAFAKFRAAEKHALPLLVFFEGCSLKAYNDCNGIATIGIGNITFPDGRRVTLKDRLQDNDEMYAMVRAYLEKRAYPLIDRYVTRRLETEEMAALISLTYNCGAEILQNRGRPSQIARLINAGGSVENLSRAFLRKAYSRKGFNNGLAVRRCMEVLYAKKLLTYEDLQNFYVCSYDKLNYKELTSYGKNGRIVKTDGEVLALVRRVCGTAPDRETRQKREWFGGDRRVSLFTPDGTKKRPPALKLNPVLFADRANRR